MILRSAGLPRHERIGRLMEIPEGSIVGARIDIHKHWKLRCHS